MQDLLEQLEDIETASIDEDHVYFDTLCSIVINCFRVLNTDVDGLMKHTLRDGLGIDTLVAIAEDNEVKGATEMMTELQSLYEKLRLLKLEGEPYEVLDTFFSNNLYKTL